MHPVFFLDLEPLGEVGVGGDEVLHGLPCEAGLPLLGRDREELAVPVSSEPADVGSQDAVLERLALLAALRLVPAPEPPEPVAALPSERASDVERLAVEQPNGPLLVPLDDGEGFGEAYDVIGSLDVPDIGEIVGVLPLEVFEVTLASEPVKLSAHDLAGRDTLRVPGHAIRHRPFAVPLSNLANRLAFGASSTFGITILHLLVMVNPRAEAHVWHWLK